jgi:hypothetical protein
MNATLGNYPALAGIGIAVAMSAGVAHDRWGFIASIMLCVLFIARRVTCCAGASRRSGPPA